MEILLIFAFISGLVTIFAPCIWPLLPIILSSTTTGGRRKPLGITLGILLSFGLLTLTISYIVKIIPFDPEILRYIAVIVIGLLGFTLIVPKLSALPEGYVSRFSGKFGGLDRSQHPGLVSGFITGLALGVVWTPCAGPILATIATLAATQSVNLNVILVTATYIIGVGIPLFIFATLGKYIFTKSRVLTKYTGRIQQIFGVVMVVTAILIATNYDKVLQAKLLDFFPSYGNFLINLESSDNIKQELKNLKGTANGIEDMLGKPFEMPKNSSLPVLAKAPEIIGITNWLNSKPLKLSDLKGKVVLVDFWTYTCINCIRTLPHITSWYEKYKDKGFVVIGVHTPEFEFEKDTANVQNAVKQYKINYPVAQDNDFATWNNYSNQYWPAKYLIDKNGQIRYFHFGEGKYEETEKAIQELLKETGQTIDSQLSEMPDETPKIRFSPETYLGSNRMQYYYPGGNTGNVSKNFTLSDNIIYNSFGLGGNWEIEEESATAGKNAVLNYNFYANKVFLVMRPGTTKSRTVKVYLDGKPVNSSNAGSDVQNGIISIDSDRLYNLIDLKGNFGNHILKLEFGSGIEIFAFTFG